MTVACCLGSVHLRSHSRREIGAIPPRPCLHGQGGRHGHCSRGSKHHCVCRSWFREDSGLGQDVGSVFPVLRESAAVF